MHQIGGLFLTNSGQMAPSSGVRYVLTNLPLDVNNNPLLKYMLGAEYVMIPNLSAFSNVRLNQDQHVLDVNLFESSECAAWNRAASPS